MNAYIVDYHDYDDVRTDSVWTERDRAEARAAELGGNWSIIVVPLNAPGDPRSLWER